MDVDRTVEALEIAVGNFEQAAYDLAIATSQMPGADWSVASAGAWGKAAAAWYQGLAWVS